MPFNLGGGAGGALSGAAAGSTFGPVGTGIGAVIGGLAGAFGGGDSAKKAAKYQNKYYARYVLPELERQQQTQQFFNNQALGTFTGSGSEAMRTLTSLGTGRFGLSEQEGGRLGDLQGLQQQLQEQMTSDDPQIRLTAQTQLQELDSLMRGQAQGDQFGGGGGGLGDFLTGHPLFEAQSSLMNDALSKQYAAAFGGSMPSSFLGKAQGLNDQQSLLNTFGSVSDVLATSAGIGAGTAQTGASLNTGLAQNTMSNFGNFGTNNALGSAQAGEGAFGDDLISSLGQFGEAFDPLNTQARQYMQQWLSNKMGTVGAPGSGGGGGFTPNINPNNFSLSGGFA